MTFDPTEKIVLAAQGYSELSMHDEALAELDSLPKKSQSLPAVLETRVIVLMHAKRWEAALACSFQLCKADPDRPNAFIHAAFCLHELGRTAEARDTLLAGPAGLHRLPTFHYNLACYECQLGELDLARAHLQRSIQLDKTFRQLAKTDPDLQALRDHPEK
jgi:tetratricopeptide (TPR) repeat protein